MTNYRGLPRRSVDPPRHKTRKSWAGPGTRTLDDVALGFFKFVPLPACQSSISRGANVGRLPHEMKLGTSTGTRQSVPSCAKPQLAFHLSAAKRAVWAARGVGRWRGLGVCRGPIGCRCSNPDGLQPAESSTSRNAALLWPWGTPLRQRMLTTAKRLCR